MQQRPVREVVSTPLALGYTLAAGCVFGALLGYLNSAQQILQQQYGLGARFPVYFGVLAVSVGGASLLNATLVMRYGMRLLSIWSLWTVCALSVVFLGTAFIFGGHPPLWALMSYLMLSFFGIGLTFSNLNALAMDPLGHIVHLRRTSTLVGAHVLSDAVVLRHRPDIQQSERTGDGSVGTHRRYGRRRCRSTGDVALAGLAPLSARAITGPFFR